MAFDAAQITVVASTVLGTLGLGAGWAQSKRQTRKDYTVVALDGFDKLIDEMRAEMVRRDTDAVKREQALSHEISRLRREVRLLTELLGSHNLPLPSHIAD